MKKLVSVLLALTMLLCLGACGVSKEGKPDGKEANAPKWDIPEGSKIGISLPTGSDSEIWQVAERAFKQVFEGAGYKTEVQWAGNSAAAQVQQLESMIVNGCRVLIILPHDDSALNIVVETAREEGILVINYDLALRGTDQVDYFVGFDNRTVGTMQAEYIVKTLGLDKGEKGPFNIELIAGSLTELNCYYYFETAMEVLQPYIDEGVLVVQSGQTDIEEVTVTDWNHELLTTRLEGLLTAYYSNGEHIDAILSPADGLSQRCVPILQNFGYGDDIPMPVITGNNGTMSVLRYIATGEIGMSIFKDRVVLAKACLSIIEAAAKGEEPAYTDIYKPNDYEFKTIFGDMVVVTKDNLKKEIIDKGVYTEDQIYGTAK